MDLHRHPGLIDRLAAEYALGVLRGAPRRRFERIAQRDAAVRVAIEAWQTRVHALAELGPQIAPPPSVWAAIEQRLGLAAARRTAQAKANLSAAARRDALRAAPRWFENLSFWRGWSIAATAVAATALVIALRPLAPQASAPSAEVAEHGPQRVAYVAALADASSNTTMMLVMWDEKNAMMTVHRMGGHTGPSEKSEQLWGVQQDGRPVSLGVLPAGGTVRMKVAGMNTFLKLAVSMEPKGGSPDPHGPTGPVVCAGKLMATA